MVCLCLSIYNVYYQHSSTALTPSLLSGIDVERDRETLLEALTMYAEAGRTMMLSVYFP